MYTLYRYFLLIVCFLGIQNVVAGDFEPESECRPGSGLVYSGVREGLFHLFSTSAKLSLIAVPATLWLALFEIFVMKSPDASGIIALGGVATAALPVISGVSFLGWVTAYRKMWKSYFPKKPWVAAENVRSANMVYGCAAIVHGILTYLSFKAWQKNKHIVTAIPALFGGYTTYKLVETLNNYRVKSAVA